MVVNTNIVVRKNICNKLKNSAYEIGMILT